MTAQGCSRASTRSASHLFLLLVLLGVALVCRVRYKARGVGAAAFLSASKQRQRQRQRQRRRQTKAEPCLRPGTQEDDSMADLIETDDDDVLVAHEVPSHHVLLPTIFSYDMLLRTHTDARATPCPVLNTVLRLSTRTPNLFYSRQYSNALLASFPKPGGTTGWTWASLAGEHDRPDLGHHFDSILERFIDTHPHSALRLDDALEMSGGQRVELEDGSQHVL
eukprot:1448488-Rhodomonas_salina.1